MKNKLFILLLILTTGRLISQDIEFSEIPENYQKKRTNFIQNRGTKKKDATPLPTVQTQPRCHIPKVKEKAILLLC